jgi:hypothetical protein
MATNQQYTISNDLWHIPFSFTVTTAGAIVPNADGSTTTEPEISVVRSGAGTYVATIRGNFQKVLFSRASYFLASASSVQTQVTAIGLGTGTATASGEATTTVTVITGNSNAVPAAADQAAGTIGVFLVLQKHKV